VGHKRQLDALSRPKACKAGVVIWPTASQPWVCMHDNSYFEPRRGDVESNGSRTSPLRGWRSIIGRLLTHGWLTVGYTTSPLRGFGMGWIRQVSACGWMGWVELEVLYSVAHVAVGKGRG
jgi:hypothetical protein